MTPPFYDEAAYDAWGNRLLDQAPEYSGGGGPTSPAQILPTDVAGYEAQYGYQTDTTTGLLLAGHRFYQPQTRRWLNRDPIGYAGGTNLYEYADDDPVNEVDPNGYQAEDDDNVEEEREREDAEDEYHPFALEDVGMQQRADALRERIEERLYESTPHFASPAQAPENDLFEQYMHDEAISERFDRIANDQAEDESKAKLSEAKKLLRSWIKDPIKGRRRVTVRYHFGQHGEEVGAADKWEYMRMAQAARQGIRGRGRPVEGLTPNTKRHDVDNDLYIDVSPAGIVSYGSKYH